MNKEKIILRKISENDYVVWKRELWKDIESGEDEFKRLLQKIFLEEEQDRSYSFMAELNGEAVGFVQVFEVLRHPSHSGKIEIEIFEDYRKKGLGKKCIQLLETFCFEELKLKKLTAPILPDNDISIAVFKSLNYERVCRDPYAFFLKGKPVPHEIYVKLAT